MTYVNCPKCGHKLLEGEDGSIVMRLEVGLITSCGLLQMTAIRICAKEYIRLMPTAMLRVGRTIMAHTK